MGGTMMRGSGHQNLGIDVIEKGDSFMVMAGIVIPDSD